MFKNTIIYKNRTDNEYSYQVAYTRATTATPIDQFDGNLICRKNTDEIVVYLFEYNRTKLTLKQVIQQYPNIFLPLNINASPLFVDEQNYDFHLQQTSPCIDAGVFLTKTSSAGCAAYIHFENAGYFCDGWGVVEGDMIKIGSRSPVQIMNIDYANNLIKINQAIDWQQGEPVSLNYSGTAPDIGPFEYYLPADALALNPPQDIKASISFPSM